MGIKDIQKIYPDDFFIIDHPSTPWIAVQFRNTILDDITDPKQWDEITLNPSSFFDNVQIEDASGFQNVTLTLTDPYFTKLETLITKAVVATRVKNSLTSDDDNFQAPSRITAQNVFSFKMDNNSLANIRIRFGYGNANNDQTRIIDDTEFSGNYKSRGRTFTVIRSPWIYLQILNASFKLTEYGLQATLNAISVVENWLTRARMLRRFYIYRDTPKGMILFMKKTVEKLSNQEVTVDIAEDPLMAKNDDGSQTIEISLGEEADEKDLKNFRTVKSFLDELCAKIPPKVYKADNSSSVPNDGTNQATAAENLDRTCFYTYSLAPDPDNKGKWKLSFFYPDPIKNVQDRMRTYIWREFATSIVKSFEVESKTDWAALNYPILISDKSYTNVDHHLFVAPAAPSSSDPKTLKLNGPLDIQDAMNDLKDMNISFVADVANASGRSKELTSLVAEQVVHFLNQGVFNGTLTIPGDPFYLFDTIVRPYEYMVRIVILRPGYLDSDGTYTSSSGLKQSYLTGYYVISKITHKIDNNGYDTILEMTRWPMAEDQNTNPALDKNSGRSSTNSSSNKPLISL